MSSGNEATVVMKPATIDPINDKMYPSLTENKNAFLSNLFTCKTRELDVSVD